MPCRHVALSVNLEFRDIDKFVSGTLVSLSGGLCESSPSPLLLLHTHTVLGGSTVIVTDSWIILSSVHTVNIIHQRDAVLKLVPLNSPSS